jgi:hypothetical protein
MYLFLADSDQSGSPREIPGDPRRQAKASTERSEIAAVESDQGA